MPLVASLATIIISLGKRWVYMEIGLVMLAKPVLLLRVKALGMVRILMALVEVTGDGAMLTFISVVVLTKPVKVVSVWLMVLE